MRFQLVQTEWYRALASAMASAGVSDVVLSPGSRSTPVVLATVAEPRLHVLPVWDERSAAFLALGMARRSGRPTVLVRTSGSAAGHDLPAVMEADMACVPLLVLSADRPPELVGSGASQTADQAKLFGDKVRGYFELGLPDAEGIDGVFRKVAQAVALSKGPTPGPVHINAPARKPLEPVEPADEVEATLHARVDQRIQRPLRIQAAQPRFGPAAFATAADHVAHARRGLLVAGPARGRPPLASAARFLEESRFVFAAELSSGLTSLGGLEAYEHSPGPDAPDIVVCLGAQPTSLRLQSMVRSADRVVMLDPWRPLDPSNRAEHVFVGPLDEALMGLSRAALRDDGYARDRQGFRDDWENLDRACGERLNAKLQRRTLAEDGGVVRRLLRALPEDGLLILGNSSSIRLADRFGRIGLGRKSFQVASQRGLAGIDGNISAGLGSALEHEGPTCVLLGDVAFAHDLNGLCLLEQAQRPFVVCVLDNGGGRIFDELPIARSAPELMPLFRTPTGLDIEAACRAFGVNYRRLDGEEVLQDALSTQAATVLHARVEMIHELA
ncbi:MAG: 2-succinyl-5-enolpyruvyl-6-hydroxy-3-cyclohexene-1-carboxylic-acid synthase [Myxococcota bacterium]